MTVTRSLILTAIVALVVLFAAALTLHAYPEPSAAVRTWQLEITYRDPQPIAVPDVAGNLQWYWYMPYKIVNLTGTERNFIPEVTIATDEGDIIAAGRGIPARVFDAVSQRLANPLLISPVQIIGRILQGEDNAKESVAIWADPVHDVAELQIFFEGLSGDTTQIAHPLTGDTVLMRKTLMLNYGLPGHAPTPQQQTLVPIDTRWIMR